MLKACTGRSNAPKGIALETKNVWWAVKTKRQVSISFGKIMSSCAYELIQNSNICEFLISTAAYFIPKFQGLW